MSTVELFKAPETIICTIQSDLLYRVTELNYENLTVRATFGHLIK
jgi:hypothetical protein